LRQLHGVRISVHDFSGFLETLWQVLESVFTFFTVSVLPLESALKLTGAKSLSSVPVPVLLDAAFCGSEVLAILPAILTLCPA
jgi:hypothetical protein